MFASKFAKFARLGRLLNLARSRDDLVAVAVLETLLRIQRADRAPTQA